MRQGGVKNSAYRYNRIMKILVLIFTLFSASNIWSAEIAYIVSEKAVIYSDMDLSIAIGYVRKGKKIKVGSVTRKHGTVLSTVASGRIVYIKNADVRLEKELLKEDGAYIAPKVSDHEVFIEQQKFEDDFSENNHVILHVGSMGTGSKWKELEETEESTSLSQIGVSIEHRPDLRSYSWAIGLNYLSSELENYAFKSILIEAKLQYSLLKTNFISIDAIAGIAGTGDARLQNSINGTESRGTLFGWIAGGQAKLFPFSQFGIIGGVELRNYSVGSLGEIELANGDTTQFDSFSGANVWVGLTYKL
tara:strand:- start:10208 stop:11122 length:915 start_codon:yes stop_codon:yes gene_type:complete